jgi:hypothetical protein
MTRDEFVSLPIGVALGVLWDLAGAKLGTMPTPDVPRPPKYDSAIYRKDGVSWASEYDVEGLRFWHAKKAQSSDPKYAEKDAKAAKALSYWIAYRIADPHTPWTGERNRETITAKAPSAKPTVYPRDGQREQAQAAPIAAADFDDAGTGDDDIPF